MEVFYTVLSGTLVVVFSQFILKIWVEPAIELRRTIAAVANLLLSEQAKITNNINSDNALHERLRAFAAKLHSDSYVLPLYSIVRYKFRLPTEKDLLLSARELNGIAGNLQSGSADDVSAPAIENFEALRKIGQHLGVRTTYADL